MSIEGRLDVESTDEEISDNKSTIEESFNEKHNIVDVGPQLRESLTAKYLKSFAYKTFRERTPRMLNDLITCLVENESDIMEEYGDYAHYDLKRVFWSLNILRNEILKNSKFKIFHDKEPDAKQWNTLIAKMTSREKNKWFNAVWLHAECYLYRRIYAAFRRTETLKDFDYFSPYKISATCSIAYLMNRLIGATRNLPCSKETFQFMLKMSVWGNRFDLSINKDQPTARMVELVAQYDQHLIVDQSADVWRVLNEGNHTSIAECPVIVDIVLDNAGYELFTDLLLAEYLLDTGLAQKVRFHTKAIPWFISDVNVNDFHWLINFLLHHESLVLGEFGRKLQHLLRNRFMVLCDTCHFWTTPNGFRSMRELVPCLYVHLSLSVLVIFKGDLNYRKLLDDIFCNPTTPFPECLGGFLPSSICALRAIKSDIYCGMPYCVVEWLTEDNPTWMCTGDKAVIQLAIKPRP